MSSIQLITKSNGRLVVKFMDELGKRAEQLDAVLDDFGSYMTNTSIPENFSRGGRPEKWARTAWSSEKNQVSTNRLQRSVTFEVSQGRLRVGTNLRYANQRQMGGKIEAKTAKALTIPMSDTAPSMRRVSRWGDRLFFLKPKKQSAELIGLLASKVGKKKIKVRFVLRKSITQPARPFVLFQDEDVALLSRRLVSFVLKGAR